MIMIERFNQWDGVNTGKKKETEEDSVTSFQDLKKPQIFHLIHFFFSLSQLIQLPSLLLIIFHFTLVNCNYFYYTSFYQTHTKHTFNAQSFDFSGKGKTRFSQNGFHSRSRARNPSRPCHHCRLRPRREFPLRQTIPARNHHRRFRKNVGR